LLEADDPQFRNSDWTPKSWAILNAEGVEIAFTEDVSILGWEACFQYTVRVCALKHMQYRGVKKPNLEF